MKKFITFLTVIGLALGTAFAQNITLKFTGATNGGAYVRIDSVQVQNVSRSWSETVVYPDTVLIFQQTGIAEAQGSTAEVASYPNPFNGTTNVTVTMPQSGDATLQVYNLAGQRVAERTMSLQAGKNLFEVRMQTAQVYLLAVTTEEGRSTLKLLNRGTGSENSISYHGNSNIVEKHLSTHIFHSGDVLKIIGYITNNGMVVASREVLQPQTASENFTLFFTLPVAPVAPTVTTTSASGITSTTATTGGNVTSDGGSAVTSRGVCWGTSQNPTLSNSHTTNGSGTGSFTSNLTGLTAGTTYYVRAYAINSVDTAYGNQITFTTTAVAPTVTTTSASGITSTTATTGGNVTSDGGSAVTSRGVCWDTSQNPTISGNHTTDSTGTGSFTSSLTGLTASTTYYVRAYAINSVDTAYGNQITFTTAALPSFSVSAGTSVVFSPGNLQWSAKNGGSTATTHTVAGGGTAAGTWRFAPNQWDTICTANSLISDTNSGWIDLFGWGTSGYNSKYPYMTSTTYSDYGNGNSNISGTNYDWGVYNAIYNPKTSTTDAPGTWRTLTQAEWGYLLNTRSTTSGIRYAKATVNGVSGLIIVPDNWSTSTYALNSTNTTGAAYTTNVITSAQWTTLENAGCAFLPAAGIRSSVYFVGSSGRYWSATYYDRGRACGLGFYSGNVSPSDYYDRCYGHSVRLVKDCNSGQIAQSPTVTTTSASGITSTTATTGGNVTSDGGSAVTSRGVCWDTSQNPTISGNHTTDSTGTGSFTSSLTGLTASTTYYVRAYAINSVDTAYGNQITFTTAALPSFSVSAGTSVVFSPGNLQWSAKNGGSTATTHTVAGGGTAAGTWRFAPNQWDTIGTANSLISDTNSGWIDLFGWGTSGYNSKYPYMTSTAYSDYGNGNSNISGTNYDWGVYNAIYNPKTSTTDAPGTWRTLTQAEWEYLLNTRSTTSGIRYAKATVNGVSGLIIVPDNWSTSTYALNSTNTTGAAYTTNVITSAQWTTLENAGCAFLPAAGYRFWTSVYYVGSGGYYWSATYYNSDGAYLLIFFSGDVYPSNLGNRYYGLSVRLVKDCNSGQIAQSPTVTTATATNITSTTATTGGNVTSDGGSAVTSRGVCWGTSQNPTLSNSHTTNGSGTGSFTSSLTGLTAGTTYYVRAYAINSVDTAYGNQIMFTTTAAGSYTFSVSAGTSVVFSPGNLQWSAKNGGSTATTHTVAGGGTAAGTWRFAPNQWDIIGANNSNISSSNSGWIDLFGWGTSGYNSKYPYMTSTADSDYGNGNSNISGTNYDWGVYNAIYNPKTSTTDAPGTWRTLTEAEWVYLLNTRSTTSGIRYAKAAVNGVLGLIIVPDNWSTSTYALNSTNTTGAAYTTNVITSAQWTTLENAGCAFLPAAGQRYGTSVGYVGSLGGYWSATCDYINLAYHLIFSNDNVYPSLDYNRYNGLSVRLVKDCNSGQIAQSPTVTTATATNITSTTATTGGNVTSDGGSAVTSRGVCWGTSQNPTLSNSHTTNGSGTGSFTSSLTGLTAGTTYYVRAYATNAAGTAYGNQITFTTTAVAPTVTTTSASGITSTTATTGGNVTSDGGSAVTVRGVCWSTSQNPTLSNSHTSNGTGIGNFTSNLTGLTAGTTYYVRAYAINSVDTAYGNQITFTTTAVAPTVTTTSASGITSTTATTGGNVTSDGGSAVTSRGVCWGTSQNPTLSNSHTTNGSGTGSFTSNLTGLTAGTTYYVRAYAINSVDTAYGNQITFTTTAVAPTVTTTSASGITSTTATTGGNVTSDGGSAVTSRGVCWGTSQNPTLSNSHTTNGSGTGSFTSNLTGLTAGTTYYVRAYAINSVDTAYGNQITFTTTAVAPTVTTTSASGITSTTATTGGNVTSDGGSAVTSRGVCWGTSQNPTLSNSHTTNGSGTGSFTSSLTGLTAGTTYYVRAYATNAAGTAYGSQITFTTTAVAPTVTTTSASGITSTTATTGGNVTSDGGSAVTVRGVCWSTSQNPTISGSHTTDGTGTGSFTSSLTGLTAGTTYYVRAYATNAAGTAYGSQITFTTTIPPVRSFSVEAGRYVYFSPGNLQWSAKNGGSTATTHTVAGGGTAAGTWRFAPNQWDIIGANNSNISSSDSGWIDFFGWGTSGYNSKYPYMTSTTYSDYCNGNSNISGTNYDWGVYNAIYNPKTSTTDAPGTWRTLTQAEWEYLLNTRSTTSGIRYAKATVNGVSGLIIVPDNWSTSTYALNSTNTTGAAYTTNVITSAQWTTLENAGCAFLPAAGIRNGTSVLNVGSLGYYWSATYNGSFFAYHLNFGSGGVDPSGVLNRYFGLSVRLVRSAQ